MQFTSELTVVLTVPAATTVTLRLLDMTGREVWRQEQVLAPGNRSAARAARLRPRFLPTHSYRGRPSATPARGERLRRCAARPRRSAYCRSFGYASSRGFWRLSEDHRVNNRWLGIS